MANSWVITVPQWNEHANEAEYTHWKSRISKEALLGAKPPAPPANENEIMTRQLIFVDGSGGQCKWIAKRAYRHNLECAENKRLTKDGSAKSTAMSAATGHLIASTCYIKMNVVEMKFIEVVFRLLWSTDGCSTHIKSCSYCANLHYAFSIPYSFRAINSPTFESAANGKYDFPKKKNQRKQLNSHLCRWGKFECNCNASNEWRLAFGRTAMKYV